MITSAIGRLLFPAVVWVALGACGGRGGDEPSANPPPAGDTVPPTVTAVFPADAATQVATTATLLATFSEAMNATTLATTFTLATASGTPVMGTVGMNGNTATFVPAGSLAHNTQYRVAISTGARDAAGNALAGPYSWLFTTAAAADATPPTVGSVVPANGATGVPVNATVGATFSEAMNAATLNSSTFSVVETSTSAAVGGSIAVSGNTATFTANGPLATSTQYTAAVGTGARDLADNGLAVPHAWSFTTASATSPTLGDSDLRFSRFQSSVTQVSTSPMTTQAAGSVIVVGMANGAIASLQSPTDNKGSSYAREGSAHAYTRWPSAGTEMYVATTVNGGANHVVTGVQQLGEELTLAAVEVRNASRVSSVWREVLSNNLPLTTASITTQGPAVLIAFWWGDADGSVAHTAVPNNGFALIESVLLQGSLVQCAVATRAVPAAGTYNVTWTSTPTQGAQLWLLAVE